MYSKELKRNLVELHQDGISVSDLSKQFNVPLSTIYRWIQQAHSLKSSSQKAVTQNDYNHLLKRLNRVEQENQIFKLSNCTLAAPLDQKLKEIMRLKEQFSIHALCDVLNVRRSTFYHYLYRKPELTKIEREDIFYRERIAAIFEQSQQRFGAKKIKAKLDEEGIRIGNKRIQRLMNEMDLKCNRDKPVRQYMPETSKQYYRNKLNREFNRTAPNTAWVSDITYCKVNRQTCYICVIIDLFSRKVLASEVSSNIASSIVSAVFLDAYIKRGQPKNLMFHSDQGGQYRSHTFKKRLRELNVTQSFSKPGCPYDNAVVESFFATIKKEELYRSSYENIGDLRKAVERYIEFYNRDRPHLSLNYKTPEQVEQRYYSKHL